MKIFNLLNRIFELVGIKVGLRKNHNQLIQQFNHLKKIHKETLSELNCRRVANIADSANRKRIHHLIGNNSIQSQYGQDLFALWYSKFKKNGFFVELGAADGVEGSNTFLLEREFGWKGILSEPAKGYHTSILAQRSASLDTRCVWSKSGELLEFKECEIGQLSTIKSYVNDNSLSRLRTKGSIYEVETISLKDLLVANRAPNHIDFLSVDTEGSEFEILRAFDFRDYKIGTIVCEKNNYRNEIFELLTSNGFDRVYEELSHADDWYVNTAE